MITLANFDDIEEIINLINSIKEEFRELNNPQWGWSSESYPNKKIFINDISKNELYKYEDNGIIKGIVCISSDDNFEYDEVIKNSHNRAYVIHRLAVNINYRNEGIASQLINYAENLARVRHIELIKCDTEISNEKMNNLFNKLGYVLIGRFHYDDYPGIYNYYEKKVK